MKTVFLALSKDVIRRNIYETLFWTEFCEQTKGVTKVLIVPQEHFETYSNIFANKEVVVEGYSRVLWRGWGKFMMFLVRTGVESHSTLVYRKRAYKRGHASLLQTLVKGFVARTLGKSKSGKHFIRKLVERLSTSEELQDLFEKYKPSSVFVPSLIDTDFDVPVSIEARRRGVYVVGMVRSWDNLNNHGILPIVPDVFILQNKWLKEAAQKFQSLDMDLIPHHIVGLPHYDNYISSSADIKPREEFMRGIGLDPDKIFMLLGGSDFYYSEDVIPSLLNDAIEDGSIDSSVQVVFRPHPSSPFLRAEYGVDYLSHVFLDDAFFGEQKFSDTVKFKNLVYHASVIINIASTLSIDAAVFDTPAICINFDNPAKKLSYYEEVHRLYDTFDHYERLVSTGGVRIPDSEEKFIRAINEYIKNPSLDKGGRKKILDIFAEPFDGNSGKRLGKIVAQYTKSSATLQ